VRANFPETVTLVLTGHDRDFYLFQMMETGAAGYLDKNERGENLLAAIRRAVNGESLFTNAQYERARHWREVAGEKWNSLTLREREIARLLVRGKSDAALAEALDITHRTASSHVYNLLQKLEVASRQEAMAWLIRYVPEMSDDL
jgi:DNA-binding NarL/FixJ family response regulator